MIIKIAPVLAALMTLILPSCGLNGTKNTDCPQNDTIPPYGFWEEDYEKVVSEVEKNDNFTKIMTRLGLSQSEAYSLSLLCADSVFNVRRIRPGQEIRSYYTRDSLRTLSYAVYRHSVTHYTIFQCRDSLAVWNLHKPVTSERRFASISITSSLWNDMVAAGAPWDLIVEMSDIFAWTVDFFALHAGDRFQAVYDVNICDGEYVGLGMVEYCTFDSGGHNVTAVRFDQGDGGNKYWAPDGGSMRKAFLKAPLKFNRVSSKFSYARKHPVTGKVRPHTGVDYAAPTGTPVHALGDGTVLSAGWTNNGGGNTIKIRHNSVYSTAYLHLSKIAPGIRAGARVAQGQVIGYVGSTGRSTGPHLDFRVWMNGTPIDPLKMESPSAVPIKAENLDSLKAVTAALEAWVASQSANVPNTTP